MHSASLDVVEGGGGGKDGGEVLVSLAALVTEARVPGKLSTKTKGFYEGPHCPLNKSAKEHKCDLTNSLCVTFGKVREQVLTLWKKNIPICLEVLLTCSCRQNPTHALPIDEDLLLEKWFFSVAQRRNAEPLFFNLLQLLNAIRSQLYFSQLTAWLTIQDDAQITDRNLTYRLSVPGDTFGLSGFTKHEFPLCDIGNGGAAAVSFLSLPRMATMPVLTCASCQISRGPLDDRMHTKCTQKGKHRCEELEDLDQNDKSNNTAFKRMCPNGTASTSKIKLTVDVHRANAHYRLQRHKNDLNSVDKGKLLLDAIERGGMIKSTRCVQNASENDSDNNSICDNSSASDICSIKETNDLCDSPLETIRQQKVIDMAIIHRKYSKAIEKDQTDMDLLKGEYEVPSASDKAKFRKDLDNAASMVFHARTGLPLTSSPAPVRRGKSCFDFDSTINSVSAIKSALYPTSSPEDDSESDGSLVSPCSPETNVQSKREISPVKYRRKGHAANLLGSFEESVLNGRLEPVSTVHGFTAELGASGSFVPKHLVVPVTVFFYTLGDKDKVSSPYLSHINLGKKGYNVPKSGTVQVTLFNPLGTVVKMFVIMYDLSDMPPNSQTFIRQRTLYMPSECKAEDVEWGPKWLRYLIHLRFITSKSGKVYLHSDIRMIIFRKSDMDTAAALGLDQSYELRSFTHMPVNPRFSPRK